MNRYSDRLNFVLQPMLVLTSFSLCLFLLLICRLAVCHCGSNASVRAVVSNLLLKCSQSKIGYCGYMSIKKKEHCQGISSRPKLVTRSSSNLLYNASELAILPVFMLQSSRPIYLTYSGNNYCIHKLTVRIGNLQQ